MFSATKVLGSSFKESLESGSLKVQSTEKMYLCTVGIPDTVVKNTFDEVCSEVLSLPFSTDRSLNFSLHKDKLLLADTHKYYINVRFAFYHLILDTLMSIFYIKENDPDAIFAINIPHAYREISGSGDSSVEFIVKVLELNNINFYILNGVGPGALHNEVEVPVYEIQNCTVLTHEFPRFMSYRDLVRLSEKYILAEEQLKAKSSNGEKLKVYVSRGKSTGAGVAFEGGNRDLGYADSVIRIYEEAYLEDYLKSCGFIVFDDFDSLSLTDQIRFMSSVDVLVGVTGTGLVNSLFMGKGKTIIELLVELPHHDRKTTIVTDYWQLSQAKEHTYIGIDLIDKQGATAVKKLKSLFGALKLDNLD